MQSYLRESRARNRSLALQCFPAPHATACKAMQGGARRGDDALYMSECRAAMEDHGSFPEGVSVAGAKSTRRKRQNFCARFFAVSFRNAGLKVTPRPLKTARLDGHQTGSKKACFWPDFFQTVRGSIPRFFGPFELVRGWPKNMLSSDPPLNQNYRGSLHIGFLSRYVRSLSMFWGSLGIDGDRRDRNHQKGR